MEQLDYQAILESTKAVEVQQIRNMVMKVYPARNGILKVIGIHKLALQLMRKVEI